MHTCFFFLLRENSCFNQYRTHLFQHIYTLLFPAPHRLQTLKLSVREPFHSALPPHGASSLRRRHLHFAGEETEAPDGMTCPRSQLWNKGIKIGISLQLLVLALFGGPLTQIFKVPHLLLDSLLYPKTKLTAFCTLCLVPGSESWFPPHPWAVAAMGRGRFGFGLFGLVFLFF